ncbi:MAG: hypothetical protein CL494_00015 [Actinobacteria bacterium]|nr:hypothetical protein [Actinomycetota bacterium]
MNTLKQTFIAFTSAALLPGCASVTAPTAITPTSYRANHPVVAQSDGNLLVEAEEFQPTNAAWSAKPWGENYYAATFANSFLSRKAYLGADEQAEGTATIRVRVPKAGRYLVLVRYEAAYRFETQFRVKVEQNGKAALDRLYGARKNLKIWAFSQKLKAEHAWSWGASENIVWEGHNAYANLKPGIATITLTTGNQPAPAAKRNIDCLLLTTDEEQVKMRIDKERYLPLDGMLTQAGDVFVKATNRGSAELTFGGAKAIGGGNWQQHSPYWVHLRNWPKVEIKVAPGKSSDWVEVGGTMDTLNDGQWNFTGNGKYRAEFAVKEANGKLSPIAAFDGEGTLKLAADADTRYSRRLRRQEDVLFDLLAEVKKEPLRGRLPTQTLIYGFTFAPGLGVKYDQGVTEFRKLFGLQETSSKTGTYIDVRSVPTAKLEEYCRNLGARAQHIRVVSLGDEISLPKPPGGAKGTVDMITWLKSRKLQPKDILPGAANWDAIQYQPTDTAKAARPGVYYWSRRYQHAYGIRAIKNRTDILRKHLPNAGIGANYSPHYPAEHRYLGEVHKWVTIFRQEGMTQPWSEDYIFQMPVATQQMNNINLDLLRAGVRGKPNQKIHYYCMPHWPGQIPENWRRLFYGALGHGMQVVNLFEFRPVHAAYTENHCSNPETYRTILRSFRELGQFEDIIQAGRKRPAKAAMWFSETGDIWRDNDGSFAAGKRTLYAGLIQQGTPLDFVIEGDDLSKYKGLILTDRHVSRAASQKIADWVNAGGQLMTTAGAGMFDELNQPNTILRGIRGIRTAKLIAPDSAQVEMVKQDLPFVASVATVKFPMAADAKTKTATFPVYAVRDKITLADQTVPMAQFNDNTPAVLYRPHGKGAVGHFAFLPGLSYFAPATPKVPVDRGTHAGASAHLIPTEFDPIVARLLQTPNRHITCSEALVEANIIDSTKGSVVILSNWSAGPVEGLEVTLPADLAAKKLTTATGAAVQKSGNTITLNLNIAEALILR